MKPRQRRAIECITGESREWHPEAVRAYFAFTDRGLTVEVSEGARDDFNALLAAHKQHPVTVEMWKEDFRAGLLFLSDFDGCPESYRRHAMQIREAAWA